MNVSFDTLRERCPDMTASALKRSLLFPAINLIQGSIWVVAFLLSGFQVIRFSLAPLACALLGGGLAAELLWFGMRTRSVKKTAAIFLSDPLLWDNILLLMTLCIAVSNI